jgi:hypothetical protein
LKRLSDRDNYFGRKADGRHCLKCGRILHGGNKRKKFCGEGCKTELRWDWEALKKRVFKRDEQGCVDCGAKAELEAHSLKSVIAPDIGFDKENYVTLCGKCHRKRHVVLKAKENYGAKPKRLSDFK